MSRKCPPIWTPPIPIKELDPHPSSHKPSVLRGIRRLTLPGVLVPRLPYSYRQTLHADAADSGSRIQNAGRVDRVLGDP